MPWAKQFDVDAALAKAMEAFWQRGYEATSMQDLVDRMGVNRGSLYATYGDKHAIFVAALRRYDETMRRDFIADIEARLPPRAAIRAMFDAFIEAVACKAPNRGCFLTNSALELAARDDAVGAIVARSQEGIEAFFQRAILAGQAQGEFSAGIDPGTAARSLLASLIGLVVLTRSRPELALLRTIADDALARLG